MQRFLRSQIKQTRWRQAIGWSAWAILTLFFIWLGGSTLVRYFQLSAIQRYGTPAKAVVLSRNISGGKNPSYYVVYSFQVPEYATGAAHQYDAVEDVAPELYETLSQGAVVDIRYDKNDPRLSIIDGNTVSPGSVGVGFLSALLGIGLLAAGVWGSVNSIRNYIREKRANSLP